MHVVNHPDGLNKCHLQQRNAYYHQSIYQPTQASSFVHSNVKFYLVSKFPNNAYLSNLESKDFLLKGFQRWVRSKCKCLCRVDRITCWTNFTHKAHRYFSIRHILITYSKSVLIFSITTVFIVLHLSIHLDLIDSWHNGNWYLTQQTFFSLFNEIRTQNFALLLGSVVYVSLYATLKMLKIFHTSICFWYKSRSTT